MFCKTVNIQYEQIINKGTKEAWKREEWKREDRRMKDGGMEEGGLGRWEMEIENKTLIQWDLEREKTNG